MGRRADGHAAEAERRLDLRRAPKPHSLAREAMRTSAPRFLQPFVSYTTKTSTTFTVNAESTYDWNAGQWTVPINLAVSQLVTLAGQPVSFHLGGRYYAERPEGGPNWGLRATR